MKRKLLRVFVVLISLLVLIVYIFNKSDYSISEREAIHNLYPSENGEWMYSKTYDNKKVVILRKEHKDYVTLIESKWGVLHRASVISELHPVAPLKGNETSITKRTWHAKINSYKMYDTVIAVATDNNEITKIIVSNEDTDSNESLNDLDEIKENSTIYIELVLEDGFAAAYRELKSPGEFKFRGLNDKGEIIILGI